MKLGFTPVRGAYDFVYEHDSEEIKEADLPNAILDIANALHEALKGFKVLYTLDTHEDGDFIPLEDIDAELEATRIELEELEKE